MSLIRSMTWPRRTADCSGRLLSRRNHLDRFRCADAPALLTRPAPVPPVPSDGRRITAGRTGTVRWRGPSVAVVRGPGPDRYPPRSGGDKGPRHADGTVSRQTTPAAMDGWHTRPLVPGSGARSRQQRRSPPSRIARPTARPIASSCVRRRRHGASAWSCTGPRSSTPCRADSSRPWWPRSMPPRPIPTSA